MIRSAASATICVALQAWVLSAAFVRDGLKSSVNLTSRLLSIFTSTLNRTGQRSAAFLPPQQASLPGTPVLEEKPRWVRSLCKHQK